MSWVIAVLTLELWSIGFLVFKLPGQAIHLLLLVSFLSSMVYIYQRGRHDPHDSTDRAAKGFHTHLPG